MIFPAAGIASLQAISRVGLPSYSRFMSAAQARLFTGLPFCLLLALFASVPSISFAKEERYSLQLIPFAGYRFGGTFEDKATAAEYKLDSNSSYGLTVNFPSQANTEWEIYLSSQATALDNAGFEASAEPVDVNVDYLQVGGTYLFPGTAATVPYFVATVGATRIDPDGINSKSDTFFSFGVGGGWKYFPSRRIGLRLDGRLLGTFVSSDSRIFCQSGPSGGSCAISTAGNILYQFEAQLGVIFRF